jgi:hypothetical protein
MVSSLALPTTLTPTTIRDLTIAVLLLRLVMLTIKTTEDRILVTKSLLTISKTMAIKELVLIKVLTTITQAIKEQITTRHQPRTRITETKPEVTNLLRPRTSSQLQLQLSRTRLLLARLLQPLHPASPLAPVLRSHPVAHSLLRLLCLQIALFLTSLRLHSCLITFLQHPSKLLHLRFSLAKPQMLQPFNPRLAHSLLQLLCSPSCHQPLQLLLKVSLCPHHRG